MAKRIPRKKRQRRNSPNHSDLYTDENPKDTIKGLKFATVKDAEASVNKIKRSGRAHNHKTQAAIAMEQRAKAAGKKSAAAVYRKFIEQQKKKTKEKNESLLRSFVKGILQERNSRFNQMTKEEITGLRTYLQSCDFMNVDAGGDYEDGDTFVSEAQQKLIEELDDWFGETFPPYGTVNVQVRVDSMLTLPDEGPNKVLKGASYFFEDGLHFIDLILAQMDDGQTLSQLADVAKKVYEVVSHELVHMHQFIKYSKGEPDDSKWTEFKSVYDEASVAAQGGDYFFFDQEDGPSELESFSLQIANELIADLGKEEAMRMLPSKRARAVQNLGSLKNVSASLQDMARKNVDFNRPEFLDMLKRSRQYIARMS